MATHFIQERWNESKSTAEIQDILQEFHLFLKEKNRNNQYTHQQLRSALFGIKLALPHLFTCQDFPTQKIPNTTNHIDGGVNTKLKDLNRRHRGMSLPRRDKLLINMLYNLMGKREFHALKNVL